LGVAKTFGKKEGKFKGRIKKKPPRIGGGGGGGGAKWTKGNSQIRSGDIAPTELKTSVFVAVHTGCHID